MSVALQQAVNEASTADKSAILRVYTSASAAHARWLHTDPEHLVCAKCNKCLSDEAADKREERKQQAVAEGELVVAAGANDEPAVSRARERKEPSTSRFYVLSRSEVCPFDEATSAFSVLLYSSRLQCCRVASVLNFSSPLFALAFNSTEVSL